MNPADLTGWTAALGIEAELDHDGIIELLLQMSSIRDAQGEQAALAFVRQHIEGVLQGRLEADEATKNAHQNVATYFGRVESAALARVQRIAAAQA